MTIQSDFQDKTVLYFAVCMTILLLQQSYCFLPSPAHQRPSLSNGACSSCSTTNRQFQSLHHIPQTILFQPLYSSKASSRRKGHKRSANQSKRPPKQGFHQSHVNTEPEAVEFDVHHTSLLHKELDLHHVIGNHDVKESRAGHHTKQQMHDIHNQPHHHQQQHHQPSIQSFSKPMSNLLRHIIPSQDQSKKLVSNTPEWKRLVKHAEYIKQTTV